MTTIKLKDFDNGEAKVCRSKHVGGAILLTLGRIFLEDRAYRVSYTTISPKEARSIAKALLEVADEVEKEQKE